MSEITYDMVSPETTQSDGAKAARAVALTEERLAAVRLLVSSERREHEWDVLLATALEYLAAGPRNTDELLAMATGAWPGARFTKQILSSALDAAVERRLVHKERGSSTDTWRLAESGRAEVAQSRGWAEALLQRCETYLWDEARRVLGDVALPDVKIWHGILLDAVIAGMPATSLQGSVVVLNGKRIAPPAASMNLDAVRRCIEHRCADADVRRFLEAMANAAFDPASAFWSELLEFVTVGYLLFGYMGRLDHPEERALIGSLRGETVVLDTPVLLRLLGASRLSNPVLEILAATRAAGVDVVVFEKTLDELERVLERFERNEVPSLERGITNGTDLRWAEWTVDSAPAQAWLSRRHADGAMPAWEVVRDTARQLRSTLTAIGARVGEPVRMSTVAESGRWLAFKERLAEMIHERRPTWERPSEALDHDATVLSGVERMRSENPSCDRKMWPGAVILTTDTFLDTTYRACQGVCSDFPVAMRVSEWAVLLGGCSEPVEMEKVARALSREIPIETLLQRAVRLPAASVVELAAGLTGSTVTPVERQLTIGDLISLAADGNGVTDGDGRDFVASVLDKHSRRNHLAAEAQRRGLDELRLQTEKEREITQRVLEESTRREAVANARALSEQQSASQLRDQLAAEKRRMPVVVVTAVACTVLAIGAGICVLAGRYKGATGFAFAAGTFWAQMTAADLAGGKRTGAVLLAAVGTLLGVVELFG